MLALHESTISRKLDKLTKAVRKQIVAALERKGMNRRQAAEALEVDVRDLQLNIRDRWRKNSSRGVPDKKGEVRTPDLGPRRRECDSDAAGELRFAGIGEPLAKTRGDAAARLMFRACRSA